MVARVAGVVAAVVDVAEAAVVGAGVEVVVVDARVLAVLELQLPPLPNPHLKQPPPLKLHLMPLPPLLSASSMTVSSSRSAAVVAQVDVVASGVDVAGAVEEGEEVVVVAEVEGVVVVGVDVVARAAQVLRLLLLLRLLHPRLMPVLLRPASSMNSTSTKS